VKKILQIFLSSVLICGLAASAQTTGKTAARIAKTIAETDLIPEGIAYDPLTKSFFVSSTYKRKIVRIDSTGQASDFVKEQQYGLLGVVGMRVDAKRRFLWAACGNVGNNMPMKNYDSSQLGFTGLFKFNLSNGKMLKKYLLSVPGVKHFFNDLTLDSTGKPYVTDTWNQKIYTLNEVNDKLEIFLDVADKYSPNGIDITPDNKYLYVAMYASPNAVIGRIDIATRQMQLVNLRNAPMSGADGLYFYENSLIAILPNEPKDTITRFFLNKEGLSVTRSLIHISGSDFFSQPTTGVVVGDSLYFVATSNLHLFNKLYNDNHGKVDPQLLPPVRIGVIAIRDN